MREQIKIKVASLLRIVADKLNPPVIPDLEIRVETKSVVLIKRSKHWPFGVLSERAQSVLNDHLYYELIDQLRPYIEYKKMKNRGTGGFTVIAELRVIGKGRHGNDL